MSTSVVSPNSRAKSLILETYCPRVALVCSPEAEAISAKNNLSFAQLIQPFSSLTNFEVSWLEPMGTSPVCPPKGIKLSPIDIVNWKKSSSSASTSLTVDGDSQGVNNRKVLNTIVAELNPPLSTRISRPSASHDLPEDDQQHLFQTYNLGGGQRRCLTQYSVHVPATTPWFDSWREHFLQMLQSEQQMGSQSHPYRVGHNQQYDFLNHFVACIIVLSSSEGRTDEELSNVVGRLSKVQQQHQFDWPNNWILPSVLKFYLILHDNSQNDIVGGVDSASADVMYQRLRTMYGGNFCYLLKINSHKEVDSLSNIDTMNPWDAARKIGFLKREQVLNQLQQQKNITSASANDILSLTQSLDDFSMNSTIMQSPSENSLLHPLSPELEYFPSPISRDVANNGDVDTSSNFVKHAPNGPSNINSFAYDHRLGECMSIEDTANLQKSVNEFIGKALLPYIERQARLLFESIVNRRGVMSKSFFSATKRLFGSSGKNSMSGSSGIIYAMESPEMLTRKLADIYFLFGHYSGAYQLYHQLKKDFLSDSAWAYYASSLEMAATSHFMMTMSPVRKLGSTPFPNHYVSDAIKHYIEHCRMIDSATRCALVSTECLRELENFGEVATIYIRMTSEDCDLRSALMLEQAAYTFLAMDSPRKFALHSVLAGHRYAKAGLRMHSLNCYHQAYQIYSGKGWRFAEDHVNFTIARHHTFIQQNAGYNRLQYGSRITRHLMALLVTPTPQSPAQMLVFMKEFLYTMRRLYDDDGKRRDLVHVPKLISSNLIIRIAICNLPTGEIAECDLSSTEDDFQDHWNSLEEQVVRECLVENPTVITNFKASSSRLLFHGKTDNTISPKVPCSETFYVEISVRNPLSIHIQLGNVHLLFHEDATSSNSPSTITSTAVEWVTLQPEETKVLRFGVIGYVPGVFHIDKLAYDLNCCVDSAPFPPSVPFQQHIRLKGPRLNSNKAERCGRIYGHDLRNKIQIIESMPLLQAAVEDLSGSLFHSQRTKFSLMLQTKSTNGSIPQTDRISRVVLACENMKDLLEVQDDTETGSIKIETEHQTFRAMKLKFEPSVSLELNQDACVRIPCVLKVPQSGDIAYFNILVLYQIEPLEDTPTKKSKGSLHTRIPLYRVLKISLRVPLLPCVKMEYSTIKFMDASSSMGILRVHNTVNPNNTTDPVIIEKLDFNPSSGMVIDNVICGTSQSEQGVHPINVDMNESRNIILKIKSDNQNVSENKQPQCPSLRITWKVSIMNANRQMVPVSGIFLIPLNDQNYQNPALVVLRLKHMTKAVYDFNDVGSIEALRKCFLSPVQVIVHARIGGKFILEIDKNTDQFMTPEAANADESIQPALTSTTRTRSDDIFYVGQTSWTLDMEMNKPEFLTYSISVTRPGIYNVAPPVINVKHVDSGCQSNFVLHSPIVISQKS